MCTRRQTKKKIHVILKKILIARIAQNFIHLFKYPYVALTKLVYSSVSNFAKFGLHIKILNLIFSCNSFIGIDNTTLLFEHKLFSDHRLAMFNISWYILKFPKKISISIIHTINSPKLYNQNVSIFSVCLK